MSTIKVQNIQHTASSTNAIALASDGTATANLTNRQGKNLIINGAMQVAQRGTSATNSGYGTVDRFRVQHSGTDEAPTQEQVDVASGTTPYTLGFRKALRITNGNQTSGAGTSDSTHFQYYAESQDIANSGWNYLSSSSFVTLSFWIKSSVAQNFQGRVRTRDGTSQNYAFETGSLSADTWTKITKTIPGNSNLQFDNDTAKNFQIDIFAFLGTDDTSSAVSLDTWATYTSGTQVKDVTSTWYTTNNATLEITGVQLEVGSVATDFEHKSFGQELSLCERYYAKYVNLSTGYGSGNGYARSTHLFRNRMRAAPSRTITNTNVGSLNSSSANEDSVMVTWQSLSGTSTGEFTLELDSEL
tara:strand:+ start:136 stop:1209 length:1074 start_codon:yes stop_codon:yes gene_type:complete